ncbi:MAG: hypothetical protein HWD85_10415 [Flavobacteriaceae bacterium]|nr:hypothetical protein [Flavobacteriaceae bacterium]
MLKRVIYIFLLLISIKAVGQRTSSSPYSFFGLGQQFSSQTVEQATMGGLGIAFTDMYHINLLNPAANASLRVATYTVGMNINDLTIKDASGSQSSTSTTLSYVNLGFPLGKKAGFTFGLKPNTAVGYSLLTVTNDTNGDPFEATRFYGSGGTTKVYGSFGISLTKSLALGIEGTYIFGKTENNILSQRINTQLGTKNNEKTVIRGNEVKLGALYQKEFSNKLKLSLGTSLKFENELRTSGSEYLYSVLIQSSVQEIPRDTLSSSSIKGTVVNPLKLGVGFGLGKENKWYAGVEYESQKALKVNNSILTNAAYKYGNSSRFSVGGFYLPKANSITNYFDRVTYRAGLRFENTGLLVNGAGVGGNFTEIKDFGISFGLGLPLRDLSNLNLGIEYGKRGTINNSLIQENYFNFKISLSLNAVGTFAWFQKLKID